jgi:hypothetical protein
MTQHMDIHVPHPIRSVQDVLINLGIITLGILIALGLDQLVEARHRAKTAAEAVASFRRELAANRAQVQEVMGEMTGVRAQVTAQIERLAAAPTVPVTATPIKYPAIYFDLMSSGSWDAAIATQALGEIPYQKLKGYEEAYGVFNLFLDVERTGLTRWEELRIFGDDSATLTAEQRRALLEQLRRYENFTYIIDMLGKAALQSCDRALQ